MAKRTRKKTATPKRKAARGRADSRRAGAAVKPAPINAAGLPFEEQLDLACRELDAGRHNDIARFLSRYEPEYPFTTDALAAQYDRALAEAYAHDGSLIDAERVADRGLEKRPDDLDLYYLLAYVKLGMREYGQAVTTAREYLTRLKTTGYSARRERDEVLFERQTAQLCNFLGSALLQIHRWQEAIPEFERAVQIDPGNHLAYLNLATIHRRRKKDSDALAIIRQGLANCRNVNELQMVEKELASSATVSACLMVKNEEEMLPDCLESIRDFVDEIIVVDTGSTDRTVEIAQSFGARVYHQPWEGDFSKHRNYSIDQATGEWIFIIDADERLYDGDAEKLQPYLHNDECEIISISVVNHYKLHGGMTTHLPSVRLFRKSYGLRYEGTVHNQIPLTSKDKVYRAPARIKHLGYDLAPEKMRAKFERTRKLLEEQLAEDPNNAFALFNYAQLLQIDEHGKYRREFIPQILESAGRAVELTDLKIKKERPIHVMALNQMAWAYFHDGRYRSALETCDRAIAARSDYLDVLLLRGMALRSMNRDDDAIAAFERYLDEQQAFDPAADTDQLMLSHSDNRPAALFGIAEILAQRGETERAKSLYEEILTLRPTFINTRSRLAKLYLDGGDLPMARHHLVRQLRSGEATPGDVIGLATVYRRSRRHRKAVRYFQRAVRNHTVDPHVQLEIGRYYLEVGYNHEAVSILSDLQETYRADHDFWRDLADANRHAGRLTEAIEAYGKVLALDGPSGAVYGNIAHCCFNLKQFEAAEKHYRQALELPDCPPDVHRNLGLTLARLNRVEDSIGQLIQFLDKSESPEPDILHVIGDLHGRQGRFADALRFYERCLREDPLNPDALHNISECYLQLGYVESALVGFKQALKIDPHHESARERLVQLEQAQAGHPA